MNMLEKMKKKQENRSTQSTRHTPISPNKNHRQNEYKSYRFLIDHDPRFVTEKLRLQKCSNSTPCYSEYCLRCSNDSYHTNVKPAPYTIYIGDKTKDCEVVEPPKPRSSKKLARHTVETFFEGYEISELACLTVNLAIIPANQFESTMLNNLKKRLRRVLKDVFLGEPIWGIIEDSYHLVKDIPKGSFDSEAWRDGLADDDLVLKLHFHGVVSKGNKTRDQLTLELKKNYKGDKQVRITDVRSRKNSNGVEQRGIGGWAEYSVKRQLEYKVGKKAKMLRPILIENRRLLNRSSHRLSINCKLTRRHLRIECHKVQARMMLIDQWIYEDIDPGSDILFDNLWTANPVDNHQCDFDSLYMSKSETLLSDVDSHQCDLDSLYISKPETILIDVGDYQCDLDSLYMSNSETLLIDVGSYQCDLDSLYMSNPETLLIDVD